ncbi:MAG: DUF2851 family protein [Bacteroidota bacterium]
MIQEAFIHFVWKHQYFIKSNLATSTGQPLNIIKPGFHNTDAGPDFKEGKVVIDGLEWNGSIEIHRRSSDWHVHKHSSNESYNNVVLHVVWEHDLDIELRDGTIIPTFEIADRVDTELLNGYKALMNSLAPVPCAYQLPYVDDLIKETMIERMTVERLYNKAQLVTEVYNETGNDWEQTAFRWLAKSFGFKVNAEQFEKLAQLIPSRLIAKNSNNLKRLEALFFGQAGFLTSKGTTDEYHKELKEEHKFLSHKYALPEPMLMFQWKFMRLRPANFPSIRIAQLAAIMHNQYGLFSRIKQIQSLKHLENLLIAETSDYWRRHYRFGKTTNKNVPVFGTTSVQSVGINTVAPLLVSYGISVDQQMYVDQAVTLLESLAPEINRITRLWQNLGVKSGAAFTTQGLIQLYNLYCQRKKCLDCTIGTRILKR